MRPIAPGALGSYRWAGKTGTMAAALAASAVVAAFRWTHATRLAVITHIRARFQAIAAWTAADANNVSLGMFIGRSYSVAHTGGTAQTLTGNNLKCRTSFASTSLGDLRIATTAALAGGTVTLASSPFALGGPGRPNNGNAAAGTEFVANVMDPGHVDYMPRIADGEYPVVLAQNEGLLLSNLVAWPAAGTAEISLEIAWAEVDSY